MTNHAHYRKQVRSTRGIRLKMLAIAGGLWSGGRLKADRGSLEHTQLVTVMSVKLYFKWPVATPACRVLFSHSRLIFLAGRKQSPRID